VEDGKDFVDDFGFAVRSPLAKNRALVVLWGFLNSTEARGDAHKTLILQYYRLRQALRRSTIPSCILMRATSLLRTSSGELQFAYDH
jgi:hypothetical protein